jgi:endonuclease YncB( thermonuclease family)
MCSATARPQRVEDGMMATVVGEEGERRPGTRYCRAAAEGRDVGCWSFVGIIFGEQSRGQLFFRYGASI